jgi:hypothetical protein
LQTGPHAPRGEIDLTVELEAGEDCMQGLAGDVDAGPVSCLQ